LIDSIGGIYGPDGLALGRSMNKGVPTLLENLGVDTIQDNINKKSYLYNSCYAKAPLSPVLKADSNSIALLSDAM
jgi:hypothetical protein